MRENIVFVMPDSLEETLWASVVLINYLVDRSFLERESETITVVSKWPDIHGYLKDCWATIKVVEVLGEVEKNKVDFIFEFRPDVCYRLTKVLEKHTSEAYGIHLGTLPLLQLPPIAMEIGVEQRGSILVASRSEMDESRDWFWEEDSKFLELAQSKGAPVGYLGAGATWEEIKNLVSMASIVVGVRGTATLVAAAMGKIVVELSPEGFEHKFWATKWENRKYRMMFGPLEDMTAEFVWQKTEGLVKEIIQRKSI